MATIPFLRYGDLTIPAAKAINAAASPRGVSAAAERSVIPLVYGEDRIKGLIVNVLPAAAGSSTLLIQVLWCYAGDLISDIRFNERGLPVGATVTNYIGSQSTADASLVSAFAAQSITYADTLAGLMYSVIAMPTASFDGQLDISATIRGRRVYDPRADSTAGGSGAQRLATPSTWQWSDNPTLHASDFLRSTVYGLGRTVDQSFIAACANANDALVGSPSQKSRISGVSFTQSVSANDIAEALRAYASCFYLPGPNGIKLIADTNGSSVATYLHSSGTIASISDLQRADIGNIPTAVEVIYTDTAQIPWRDSSAVASLSGAGTTRPWRLSQIRLPGIKRYSQAFREATERLAKLSSYDVSCTLEVFDVGIVHEDGDIITVTHPIGLSSMTMRVSKVEMPAPGKWRLRLVQHNGGAYSTAVPTAPSYLSPGLVNQGGAPDNVTGLAASGGPGAGRITWSPNTSLNYRDTELRLGASWAAGTFLARINGSVYPWNIVTEGVYTVWAKHIDVFGVESTAAASINITVDAAGVAGATSDISLVPTGSVTVSGNSVRKTVSNGAWDSSVHSRESFIGGCFASCSPATNFAQVIFGINTDPATNANYTSIDYSMQIGGDGNLYAFQAATILNSGTAISTYAAGDTLMMTYYGGIVRWHKNGTVLFQVTDTSMVSSRLFFDSSFFDASRIDRIRFGPLSPDFWNTLGGKPTDPELLNSYQVIGANLIAESDQAVLPTLTHQGAANGSVFATAGGRVLNHAEHFGWTTANYVLSAGRLRNVAVQQTNRHTGSSIPDADASGNTVACDITSDTWVPCVPNQRLCASIFVNLHRCNVKVYLEFQTAAGTATATGGIQFGAQFSSNPILANVLDSYQRAFVIGIAPAGAARCRLVLRKYNTISGSTDSWVFAAGPQLEPIAANATGPGPYMPGPVGAIGTDQIVAAAATGVYVATAGNYNISTATGSTNDGSGSIETLGTAVSLVFTAAITGTIIVEYVSNSVGLNGESPGGTVATYTVGIRVQPVGGNNASARTVIDVRAPGQLGFDKRPVHFSLRFDVVAGTQYTVSAGYSKTGSAVGVVGAHDLSVQEIRR